MNLRQAQKSFQLGRLEDYDPIATLLNFEVRSVPGDFFGEGKRYENALVG